MTFIIVGILSSIRLYSFVPNVPVLYDHRLLSDLGQTGGSVGMGQSNTEQHSLLVTLSKTFLVVPANLPERICPMSLVLHTFMQRYMDPGEEAKANIFGYMLNMEFVN